MACDTQLTQVRGWKLTKVIEMMAKSRMKKVRYTKRSADAIIYVEVINCSLELSRKSTLARGK